ncbi:glycosyltransferase family 2 protein [Paraburkholderia azotifigens]|uniref:Glycosyltransferase family 2 protein n=1 Tax=Paraburkholderia azotifigens TaxID=2057004 RepID=A0A5C6VSK8_9BURK|nr:glycosyltransferase family 2 protein [Paraburkholderia azotifigens]TXC88167.1 glycosyltransferase family 2 protein [Paraburkholderia azotifigens]
MATVSILIPARRADYLGRALISAQRETFEDIEILVGDDTPDALLAPIAAAAGDSRVRYFRHRLLDARRNAQAFLNKA